MSVGLNYFLARYKNNLPVLDRLVYNARWILCPIYGVALYINGHYEYSKRTLQSIAENYLTIYDGLPLGLTEVYHPFNLAEYKADFDVALNKLSYSHRSRNVPSIKIESGNIRDYWRYGKAQRAVIADIIGAEDRELETMGVYDVKQLKAIAYHHMRGYLNGELANGHKTVTSPVDSVIQ